MFVKVFDQLAAARGAMEMLAREFDAEPLTPSEAMRTLDELAVIGRVVDGLVSRVAKRLADSGAAALDGERSADVMIARRLGVACREVRAAIETARKLDELPATDMAVRRGDLSARQAQMIVDAASCNPGAEQQLLETAKHGLVPLRDACVAARAEVEDASARARRQRRQRNLRMWTDADGMVAGAFRGPAS